MMTNPTALSAKTAKFCAYVGKKSKLLQMAMKHTSAFNEKTVRVVLTSENAIKASVASVKQGQSAIFRASVAVS